MINNRQQGRRRGRGGPRPLDGRPSGGGGGNRPETRARGNAPQLHEKYKAMARDAQLAGDRVQTEYYLQFADHYYRILNENRPRFEDRPQRDRDDGAREDGGRDENGQDSYSADEYDDEDGDEEQTGNGREAGPREGNARNGNGGDAQRGGNGREANGREDGEDGRGPPRAPRDNRPQRDQLPRDNQPRDAGRDRPQRDARPDREPRPDRGDRPQRGERPDGMAGDDDTSREVASEQPKAAPVERPRRGRPPAERTQPAPEANGEGDGASPGIDFDRLPPAISRPDPAVVAGDSDDDRPRPARRPRRPREDKPAAA